MKGEKFLDWLYKDLHLSDIVKHSAEVNDHKYQKIQKYLERLEKANNKTETEHQKALLKQLYYDKYIIKEKDIPDNLEKEKIIKKQKESLDVWLKYLFENKDYPMWIKYWIFQGMLKIGTYNESKDVYAKRNNKTTSPFIELNHKVIEKCVLPLKEYINNKDVKLQKTLTLTEHGNFAKLYIYNLKQEAKERIRKSNKQDGIWIKYSNEKNEYLKLYNSLQGYFTRWCTASSIIQAQEELLDRDFYVYYAKDENGEYKIPRIAIRLNGDSRIEEIRGIADYQNLEDGLEDIVKQKLEQMTFLDENDIEKNIKITQTLKKITNINRKNNNNEELTEEEIIFIYELKGKIEGFGIFKDKRIEQIIKSRNQQADYEKLTTTTMKIEFLIKNPQLINQIPIKDINILTKIIARNPSIIQELDQENENYYQLVKTAIQKDGKAIKHLNKNIKFYQELALLAVKQNEDSIQDIDPTIENYEELASLAISKNSWLIKHIPKNIKNYEQILLQSAEQIGMTIKRLNKNMFNYKDMLIEAVKTNGYIIKYIDKTTENYQLLIKLAIKQYPKSIQFIDKTEENYIEILSELLTEDPTIYSELENILTKEELFQIKELYDKKTNIKQKR